MTIIYFLLPLALLLGLGFAAAFVASSWWGQFDDLETPAHRILLDDDLSDSDFNRDFNRNFKLKRDSQKGTTA